MFSIADFQPLIFMLVSMGSMGMRTTFKKEEQKHTGKSEFIGATGFFYVKLTMIVVTITSHVRVCAPARAFVCV